MTQAIESNLYQLKDTAPPTLNIDSKPSTTFACRTCSSANYVSDFDELHETKNKISYFRMNKFSL